MSREVLGMWNVGDRRSTVDESQPQPRPQPQPQMKVMTLAELEGISWHLIKVVIYAFSTEVLMCHQQTVTSNQDF